MIRTIDRWNELAGHVLAGETPSREEALAILTSDDDELLLLLHAAFQVRKHFFGREVQLHVLRNAKSGRCSEDCAFCSQSRIAKNDVPKYPLQTVEEIVNGARRAYELGAYRYCIVTATRGPSNRDLDIICEAVRRIKSEMNLHICTSLGLLTEEKAARLAAAGVNRFNHNLETSRAFFPNICQSHTFEDRVQTVKIARAAGMEICSGGIMGLGESLEDRVELAFTLRELGAHSVPINFLNPRPGTPMADRATMTPVEALKCLCLFRMVNPSADIRVAGGREAILRHLQPLALYPANSFFTEGYLTTPGQGYSADRAMLEDAGFTVAEHMHV